MQSENVARINIDLIIPNTNQPRKKFDENSLKELALSIKEYGILNPILVRKKEEKYEIIAGERRYRAAKLLDLKEIPVIIRNDIDEEKITEVALIENLQRENITAIEEAESYEEILNKTSLTELELSKMIGKSQSFISNKLRLLNLPEIIQEALINKKISERHGRSLLKVKDEKKQIDLLNKIINEKLTVKELDKIIDGEDITKEDINNAISDIMKSLVIEDKKEEKESDKMNDFNPSLNQGMNNNMTLNNMNMQAIETSAVSPMPTNIEPQMPQPASPDAPIFPNVAVSSAPVAPVAPVAATPAAPQDAPLFPQEPAIPTDDSFVVQPTPAPTLQQDANSMAPGLGLSVDIPLFNEATINPVITPSIEPVMTPQTTEVVQPTVQIEQPVTPPVSIPNNEIVMSAPAPEVVQPTAPIAPEVAVSQPTTAAPTVQQDIPLAQPNKLLIVQEYLNANGIPYKTYSNDTGSCIIIEL